MTYTCLHEKGANNIQCPHTLQRFPTYIEEQGFLSFHIYTYIVSFHPIYTGESGPGQFEWIVDMP